MIIALEGVDASGKATQSQRMKARFESIGVAALVYDFPHYQSETGKVIKKMLKEELCAFTFDAFNRPVDPPPKTTALILQSLMTANRYEAIDLLQSYKNDLRRVLILDRYWASGLVYGASDGLDEHWLMDVHAMLPAPDAWVLLDIPVELSFIRRPKRRDKYEGALSKIEDVASRYRDLFALRDWYVVNGVGSVDDVEGRIWMALSGLREVMSFVPAMRCG
jgi:dTMP kinase